MGFSWNGGTKGNKALATNINELHTNIDDVRNDPKWDVDGGCTGKKACVALSGFSWTHDPINKGDKIISDDMGECRTAIDDVYDLLGCDTENGGHYHPDLSNHDSALLGSHLSDDCNTHCDHERSYNYTPNDGNHYSNDDSTHESSDQSPHDVSFGNYFIGG